MNKKLRKYLETIGLAAGATEQEAVAFWNTRTGHEKEIADALATKDNADPAKEPAKDPPKPADPPATPTNLGGQAPATTAISDAERQRIGQEALTADKVRRDAIIALAKGRKLPEDWARGLAERGVSLAEASNLADLAEAMQPLMTGAGSVRVGEERGAGMLREAMSDALCLRAGVELYETDGRGRAVRKDGQLVRRKPNERAEDYSRLSFVRIAATFLSAQAVPGVGTMSDGQILELAMNPRMLHDRFGYGDVSLAMSSTDFPYVLGDAMRKTIRALFAEAEQEAVWPRWCGRITLPDYREMEMITVSEVPDLLLREEGADVRYATFTDGREKIRVYIFSRAMRFTVQAMRNDQFGVFIRQIRGFPTAAVRLLDRGSTAVLVANANLADNVPLFDELHFNLAVNGNVGAPSVATLSAARVAMRTQKGMRTAEDGDKGPAVLNLRPRTLLTPVALEDAARSLIAAQFDPAGGVAQVPNPLRNFAEVVGNPYLDEADAPEGWYLTADPNGPGGGVQIGFLEGEEVPSTRSEVDFDTGDLKVVCEHKAGFKADNHRGLYYNPGT